MQTTAPDSRGSRLLTTLGSIRAAWLVPVAFFVLSAVSARPIFSALSSSIAGGPDGVLYIWYFGWIRHAALGGHNALLSGALNAPAGVNLMWNTPVLGLAVPCLPLTALFGPVVVVNLLMIFASAVSATACYFVLLKLTDGAVTGAVLGSLLYGYGPYMIGQFSHLHLSFAPLPPLLLYAVYQLVTETGGRPTRVGIRLGLLAAWQFLIGEEVLVLTVLAAVTGLVWFALLDHRRARVILRPLALGCAAAAGVGLAIAAVPLWIQFTGPNSLSQSMFQPYRIDLAAVVRPSLLQAISTPASRAANLTFPANGAENTGYLGWPLLIALILGLLWLGRRSRRTAVWLLLVSASLGVMMLGSPIDLDGKPIGHGPWALVRKLPLLGGVVVPRVSLMVLLVIAVTIAWVMSRLRGTGFAVAVLVVALALVPLWPNGLRRANPLPDTPRFFTTAAVHRLPPNAVAVVFPQAGFPDNQAMYWQVRAGFRFRLVGGYSVFRVNGHASYFPEFPAWEYFLLNVGATGRIDHRAMRQARAQFQPDGVQAIVVTRVQRHWRMVVRASEQVTGCIARPVADVSVCPLS